MGICHIKPTYEFCHIDSVASEQALIAEFERWVQLIHFSFMFCFQFTLIQMILLLTERRYVPGVTILPQISSAHFLSDLKTFPDKVSYCERQKLLELSGPISQKDVEVSPQI